jgi:hypothetical protein
VQIAYHNPWIEAAENQTFASLVIAAQSLGVTAHACTNHEDIEACNPDFVLSVSSSVPKMVDVPSYLTVHAPPGFFLETPGHLYNLLSYDGFVTISDSIGRFLRDLMIGVGRDETPGFYYTSPQITNLRMDWSAPPCGFKVVYLGTNWDRRLPDLFRVLDQAEIIRIFGPEAAWKSERYRTYSGPLPFDGLAPQRVYARYGIGLALLADRWWQEDVISNRIFEIASVGAVAICPDMPWTRKWFGNSVLYFNPADTPVEIARQIDRHHEFCCANPKEAQRMAEAAREVFEKSFACEKLLVNLMEYHERKAAARSRRLSRIVKHPEISVIVRCGGRPVSFVKRAVDSIRAQRYGQFTAILVKYADIDLTLVTSDTSGAIREFIEISVPGGGRAETLFKGLRSATTEYFAVLDDDDFWLSDHFEELFRAGQQICEDFDVAFSGSVAFDYPIFYRENQFCTRNILLFGFSDEPVDVISVQSAIGTNCFVARRDLLTDQMLDVPDMRTGEDSLLIALIVRKSKPIFSYRATAFFRRGAADGSNWASDPNRQRDEMSLALRAGLLWTPKWLRAASFDVPTRMWRTTGFPALPQRREEEPRPPPTIDSANPDETSSARIRELEGHVRELLSTTSWRITAPLRAVAWLVPRSLRRQMRHKP